MPCPDALVYADNHAEEFQRRWFDLLRIETISAQSEHRKDIRRAAGWLHDGLSNLGLATEILETVGHPVVFADSGPIETAGPTVLVYGHYDVQPPGDLNLWTSPPFRPELRDGRVYARGACDDKGQMLTHLFAVEAWRKTSKAWPVRIKFLIEGEEEIGSPSLASFVERHRDRLACDYVLISDTSKFDAETPGITYGTKGLVYKEILIQGPAKDLHSGSFGGTIANPANALVRILTSLTDSEGRILIPGFYDAVQELSPEEKKMLSDLPFDESEYLREVGSSSPFGEPGYSTLERRWARPTLDINGLFGGYAGEGAATILPASAGAKVSMRLVPCQDSGRISESFERAVRNACPAGVKLEIRTHGVCDAYVAPLDDPIMTSAAQSLEQGFGHKPVFLREGGTLPILPMFKSILGADSLLLGYAHPGCDIHSPNEWFSRADFHAGIRSNIHLLDALRAWKTAS